MNRSKRPISARLRKKMTKAIRDSQTGLPPSQANQYSDELTAKEMLKIYPKRAAKKKEELLAAMKASIKSKQIKTKKGHSKRTTPGLVQPDSSPAYPHREGKRWIKNLNKQTAAQRVIDVHNSRKK
jgi:hypothetical protein